LWAGYSSVSYLTGFPLYKIKIDKSLVDPTEVEVLEDLVVAAFNDGKSKVEAHVAEEMAKLTGGLKLPPGIKLPF